MKKVIFRILIALIFLLILLGTVFAFIKIKRPELATQILQKIGIVKTPPKMTPSNFEEEEETEDKRSGEIIHDPEIIKKGEEFVDDNHQASTPSSSLLPESDDK